MIVVNIAVQNFTNSDISNLTTPISDAKKLVEVLQKKYEVSRVINLFGKEVKKESIQRAFVDVLIGNKIDEEIVIFLNGHGVVIDGTYYYVLRDSDLTSKTSLLSINDLQLQIDSLNKFKKIAIIINSCESGAVFNNDYFASQKGDSFNHCRIIVTSSVTGQSVQDLSYDLTTSPFTNTMIDYLGNNTDTRELDIETIIGYVKRNQNSIGGLSTVRYGYFQNHGGGYFRFLLKSSESDYWKNAIAQDSEQSYIEYLEKYEGVYEEHTEIAKRKLNGFVEDRNEQYNILQTCLREFTKYDPISNSQTAKEYNELKEKIKNLFKNVKKHHDVESEWLLVQKSKEVEKYKKFEEEYIGTKYAKIAMQRRQHIEYLNAEKEVWINLPNKRSNLETRIARVEQYLNRYTYGKFILPANRLINDLLAYQEILETQDLVKKKELCDEYIDNPEYKEYTHEVKKEIQSYHDSIKFERLQKELEGYVEKHEIKKVLDIMEYIEGCNEQDQDLYNELKKVAEDYVKKDSNSSYNEFSKLLYTNDSRGIKEFLEGKHQDEWIIEMQNYVNSLDVENWNEIKESKSKEDYIDYLSFFSDLEGSYIIEARNRIEEILGFESIASIEGYISYLEDENHSGLFQSEAKEELENHRNKVELTSAFNTVMKLNEISEIERSLNEYDFTSDQQKAIVVRLNNIRKDKLAFDHLKTIYEADVFDKPKLIQERLSYFEGYSFRDDLLKVKDLIVNEINIQEATNSAIENLDKESLVKLQSKGTHFDFTHTVDYKLLISYVDAIKTSDLKNISSFIAKYPDSKYSDFAKQYKEALILENEKDISILYKFLEEATIKSIKNNIRQKIDKIEENEKDDAAYNDAKAVGTKSAFVRYLSSNLFKQPENVRNAKRAILSIEKSDAEDALLKTIVDTNDEKLCVEYLSKYENGKYRSKVKKILGNSTVENNIELQKTDEYQSKFLKMRNLLVLTLMFLVVLLMFIIYKVA